MIDILRIINENPGISQRRLARLCGLSLGKVNMLTSKFEVDGLITKKIKGKTYCYFLTNTGVDNLEKIIKSSQEVVINLHQRESSQIKSAVILGSKYTNDFESSVYLQSIGDQTIIERLINQVQNLGIENIVVILRGKQSKIEEYFPHNIHIIEDEDYKWTGTMATLAKIFPYIKEDFILIEGNLIIETIGLKELLEDEQRDSILITAESGVDGANLVEIRNHRLFKISKDITQLNHIDGEMIGVCKISYPFFLKMLDFYGSNRNPYLNYEYLMLDVASIYSLNYKKVDNLLYYKVDNEQHLEYVQTKLIRRMDKKEKMLQLEILKKLVSDCLEVDLKCINKITPIGGMTNKNYKVEVNQQNYVLRIPGNGTESMISRTEEIKNAVFAHEIGVDADLIYFNEQTGIKISKFIENAQTLSPERVKNPYVMKRVCDILNKLHHCGREMENRFDVYEKIYSYEKILDDLKGEYYADYEMTKERVLDLKHIMEQMEIQLVPCHNDTVAENFIKDDSDHYYLIDWEYAGMNDPMWDLAAHCLENEFNDIEEELFLKTYFHYYPPKEYKIRLLINKIYQDFLWSLWTKVKEASGDDFGDYGIMRYNRAKANLELLAQQLEG